jgi:hypothetical protein
MDQDLLVDRVVHLARFGMLYLTGRGSGPRARQQ